MRKLIALQNVQISEACQDMLHLCGSNHHQRVKAVCQLLQAEGERDIPPHNTLFADTFALDPSVCTPEYHTLDSITTERKIRSWWKVCSGRILLVVVWQDLYIGVPILNFMQDLYIGVPIENFMLCRAASKDKPVQLKLSWWLKKSVVLLLSPDVQKRLEI